MVKPEILMQDRLEGKTGKQSKQAGRGNNQQAGRAGHMGSRPPSSPLKRPHLRALAILHYRRTS